MGPRRFAEDTFGCYLLEPERVPEGVNDMATIRARYEKGVLTPLEPLDLEEGKEVVVSVQDAPQPGGEDHMKSSTPSDDSSCASRRLRELSRASSKGLRNCPRRWPTTVTLSRRGLSRYYDLSPKWR